MMNTIRNILLPKPRTRGAFTWGDAAVLLLVCVTVYVGVRLALDAPAQVTGPQISLSPRFLPYYTLLSVGRMAAAFALSLVFALVYGRLAAYNRRLEQVLMPLLDVLQSMPILSFLPVVLLGLSALLPLKLATELASIVLIFTSQAWNLTFGWYQSLTTIPKELREASAIFRLSTWLRFKRLELPFGMISLIWNSMMSWAGGWFFLMAAEIFTVGSRDYRLPGLGAYLKEASSQGDFQAILWGVLTLVVTILALDQFIWRPLLAWSDRFKLAMLQSEEPPGSWFFELLSGSRLVAGLQRAVFSPLGERLDSFLSRRTEIKEKAAPVERTDWATPILAGVLAIGLAAGGAQAAGMLAGLPVAQWGQVGLGLLATLGRVLLSLLLALVWTIPVGTAIGTNRRLAAFLQPVVQVAAAVPATAIFPVFLLVILQLSGGVNLAAVLLMLMGTQWYLLFNIIAGASAIPQELKHVSALMGLSRWQRWRSLLLPALFPYIITGAITASGGAWNASIVAEYVSFAGQTLQTRGIGALISQATASGDYPLLLASTLSMIVCVVLINRLLWQRFYRLAEEKYRME